MQIPILVEPVAGNGYRARGGEPFGFTAEGPTREEAVGRLREMIRVRLGSGAEILSVEVPAGETPWLRLEGAFAADPQFDEWQQAIAEYRQRVEDDPDAR